MFDCGSVVDCGSLQLKRSGDFVPLGHPAVSVWTHFWLIPLDGGGALTASVERSGMLLDTSNAFGWPPTTNGLAHNVNSAEAETLLL